MPGSLDTVLNVHERQMGVMRKISRRIPCIRPQCLRPAWYRSSLRTISSLLVLSSILVGLMTLANAILKSFHAWRNLGDALRSSQANSTEDSNGISCSIGKAFSWPELIFLLESNLFSIPLLMSTGIIVSINMLQVIHQLHLTEETSAKVRRLLDRLRARKVTWGSARPP